MGARCFAPQPATGTAFSGDGLGSLSVGRIRSLKPEFGHSEKLSAEHSEVHLLAALLLTYADDEGYFNANPKLVQAACCPLREFLVSIPEILVRLTAVGYIEILEGTEGRRYGRVVNFLNHQRVAHPTPSKIRALMSSPENFVKSPDTFSPDLGTGNREVEQGSEIPPDLHPNQYATRLLEEISFPVNTQNIKAVASAIECEVTGGKSKAAAYEFLLACTRDAMEEGFPITTFFFTEAKYRPQNRRNGNGKSQPSASAERSERSKQNILDGFAANARRRDAPDGTQREVGAAKRVGSGV